MRRTLRIAAPIALVAAVVAFFALRPERVRVIGTVPDRYADSTFWRMFDEMSEPDGDFHSNNFVSNETELQYVIPPLKRVIPPGGVYLGVGPEQNFTYIVALQPRVAFIVDIRRQNAMAHLMYKALIETSVDRADFLERLFSRRRHFPVDSTSSAAELVASFSGVEADSDLRDSTMEEITHQLRDVHHFPVTDEDLASVEFVLGAFYERGIDLSYAAGGRYTYRSGGRSMPTFALLMAEADSTGVQRGFLANEANFRALQDIERRNAIIPLVGDFSGPKALRSVARWLKERAATVNAFYLSNVEQYLFQSEAWKRFYENVAALPRDSASTFIRSFANRGVWQRNSPIRIAQRTQLMNDLLRAVRRKQVRTYNDLLRMNN